MRFHVAKRSMRRRNRRRRSGFGVEESEIFDFLGPDGAGLRRTVRTLARLVEGERRRLGSFGQLFNSLERIISSRSLTAN